MNKFFTNLLLFLFVLFTACQSDEPAIDEGGKTDGKDLGYIAVSIVQPKSVTGRATDNFSNGTDDENFANEATFIIYKVVQNGGTTTHEYLNTQTIPLTAESTEGGTNPAVEKIYQAVLVIDADDALKPNQASDPRYAGLIYCVLNAPSEIKAFGSESNTDKSESTLLDMINEYDGSTKGAFIMSNSTYRGFTVDATSETENQSLAEEITCGTPFTKDDYFTTANAAIKKPVPIYVERVVAKVRTKTAESFTNEQPNPFNETSDNDKLTIRITGMEIANIAEKSYLFKNVSTRNTTGSGWPDWNESSLWDAKNKRCYWETVPSPLNYKNLSYNDIVKAIPTTTADDEGDTSDKNVYKEFSSFDQNFYIQPNTSDQKTSVLVTAQLLDNNKQPADLVWIKGGYFHSADALNLVCTYLKANQWAIKKTENGKITEFRDIKPEDLHWERYVDPNATDKTVLNGDLKDYQAIAQVNALAENLSVCKASDVGTPNVKEIYKNTESLTSFDLSDLNGQAGTDYPNRLANEKSLFAEVFKDGLCYYFVNIDQTGVLDTPIAEDTKHFYGVVRNHIYELTLNSIKGIGTAVFDPDATIIPVKPPHDEFYYLAAQINVLKWRFVKQEVNFEGN